MINIRPVPPFKTKNGEEMYVLYLSTMGGGAIRRAAAWHKVEGDVLAKYAGRDRRRIKREMRKAIARHLA